MKENNKSGHVADDAGYVDEGQHELRNERHVSLRRNAAHYVGHHRRHVNDRSVVKPILRQHDDRTFCFYATSSFEKSNSSYRLLAQLPRSLFN